MGTIPPDHKATEQNKLGKAIRQSPEPEDLPGAFV